MDVVSGQPRRGLTLLRADPGLSVRLGVIGALLVVLVLLPVALEPYQDELATRVLIYALFAMSLDLLYGYAGLMSLGHAAFFGVGAYGVGVLMVKHDVASLWIGAPLALVATAVAAAILGLIALRTRAVYFVLVTFALGEMLATFGQQSHLLQSFGAEALSGIPRPTIPPIGIVWNAPTFYYFTLIVVAVATVALVLIVRSRFGDVLRGIRENEGRMSALGYDPWRYKYAAFIVSGIFAGLAGILFAYQNELVAPTNVDVTQSGLVLLMVILGGPGRLVGAAVGAAVVVLVQYYANTLTPSHVNLVMGILFVLTVLLLRGGLVPTVTRAARRVRAAT